MDDLGIFIFLFCFCFFISCVLNILYIKYIIFIIMSSKYNCEDCSIHTNIKQVFDRHLLSKRHAYLQDSENNNAVFTCDVCNKRFKRQGGLFYHKKKCIKDEVEGGVVEGGVVEGGVVEAQVVEAPVVAKEQSLNEQLKEIIQMINDIKEIQGKTIVKNIVQDFDIDIMFNDTITVAINGVPLPIKYDTTKPEAEYMKSIGRQIRQEINRMSIMNQYMNSIIQRPKSPNDTKNPFIGTVPLCVPITTASAEMTNTFTPNA